ncbi:MAG: DUF222 domain-containing protein [Microbacteriaceae bacterium]|nr:DUF222 domain-containing protein [Microbacteriaceae bacterium]
MTVIDAEGQGPFFRPTDELDRVPARGSGRDAGVPVARARGGARAGSADGARCGAGADAFDWESAFSPEERAALAAFEAQELERIEAELERDARAFFESIGLHDFDDPGPSDADLAAMLAEGARRESECAASRELWGAGAGAGAGDVADADLGAAVDAGAVPVSGAVVDERAGAVTGGHAPPEAIGPVRTDAPSGASAATSAGAAGAGDEAPAWVAGRVAALAAAWAAAAVPGAAAGVEAHAGGDAAEVHLDGELSAMTDSQLLGLLDAAAGLHRQLTGAIGRMASEIADRSELVAGEEGLARRSGHRNARTLVAAALGAPVAEARRLIRTGRALTGGRAITGEALPPQCPHVDAAVTAGDISTHAADALIALRDRVCHRVEAAAIDEVEEMLVEVAQGMTLNELETAIGYAEAHLDPDGTAPRIEEMREHRSLTFGRNAAGMITLNGRFDPETAAPIRAAIESIVTHQLRASRGANLVERDEFRRLADGPALELRPVELAADAGAGAVATAGADAVAAAGVGAVATTGAAGDGDGDGENGADADCEAGAGADLAAEGDLAADGGPGAVSMEGRSLAQLRAEALATLCAHASGCDSDDLPAPSTAVVVRIPVERLADPWIEPAAADAPTASNRTSPAGAGSVPLPESFVPVCEIDGFGPIDAGTARRMAASADIIPLVLGADSEILDLGRTKRLFTKAQRLALVERDAGCAFCGLPPGFAEAHHLVYWRHGGGTDLGNAVLLCTTCHHRVHDGWDVVIVPPARTMRRAPAGEERVAAPPGGGGTVWFIPPATVDRQRAPRLGGRKRFDPAYRRAHPPEPPPGWETESTTASGRA